MANANEAYFTAQAYFFTFQGHKARYGKTWKKRKRAILMNHSGFTDFEIAYTMLYPRKFNTVAAYETFMGLEWLMKADRLLFHKEIYKILKEKDEKQ